jgi:hypothetical protein
MKRLTLVAVTLLAFVASAYAQFTFTSIDYPGGGHSPQLAASTTMA